VWLLYEQNFQKKVSPTSSGWKESETTIAVVDAFQLLVTANVVPSSLILSIRKMKAIRSSEMSVHTRAT
jgi:hypothetical protein